MVIKIFLACNKFMGQFHFKTLDIEVVEIRSGGNETAFWVQFFSKKQEYLIKSTSDPLNIEWFTKYLAHSSLYY